MGKFYFILFGFIAHMPVQVQLKNFVHVQTRSSCAKGLWVSAHSLKINYKSKLKKEKKTT